MNKNFTYLATGLLTLAIGIGCAEIDSPSEAVGNGEINKTILSNLWVDVELTESAELIVDAKLRGQMNESDVAVLLKTLSLKKRGTSLGRLNSAIATMGFDDTADLIIELYDSKSFAAFYVFREHLEFGKKIRAYPSITLRKIIPSITATFGSTNDDRTELKFDIIVTIPDVLHADETMKSITASYNSDEIKTVHGNQSSALVDQTLTIKNHLHSDSEIKSIKIALGGYYEIPGLSDSYTFSTTELMDAKTLTLEPDLN